jgi:hypothetical protein
MTDHEREFDDDAGLSDGDAVIRPEGARVAVGAGTLTVTLTATARAEVIPAPELTTAGIEVEHERRIRYSPAHTDGMRYAEVVDGSGEYVRSTMGTAQDALEDVMLYLLPPDDPGYPKD